MRQQLAKILPNHASGSQVHSPELPIIQQGENLLVDARILHKKLESRQEFAHWIKNRITDYGFYEGEDYLINLSKTPTVKGGRPKTDYLLFLDTAKELAMIERNEIGRQVRRYFIQKEKEARATTSAQLSPNLSALLADIAQVQNKNLRLRMMAKLLPGMELPNTPATNAPADWEEAFNQQYGSHTHAFIDQHAKRWLWQGKVLNGTITEAYDAYTAEHSLRHPISASALTHAIAAYCAHHSIPYRYGVSVRIGRIVRKAKLFGNAALKGGSYE